MVGSLSNLYERIKDFNETYIQPNQEKDTLLKPKSENPNLSMQVPLLPLDSTITVVAAAPPKKCFYRCSTYSSYSGCYSQCNLTYVNDDPSAVCPACGGKLGTLMTFVDSLARKSKVAAISGGEGGFVKGVATYMVMDDLVVKPLSIISSITQLSKCNVKEVGVLEERIVEVRMDEGVKLLKESLQSKTVLTNVFLTTKVEPVDVDFLPSYF